MFIMSAVVILVAYPFFLKEKRASSLKKTETKYDRINSQKEAILLAIKELEFDYYTGKLSEDDFNELKEDYKSRAISILKNIEKVKKDGDKDEFEKEIMLKRQQRKKDIVICKKCKSRESIKAKYCSQCGEKL